jgi:ERCC4-type nuclease
MQVTVVVDDREPAALVAAVREHPDVADIEVDRLAAGDIVVGNVGFERKTIGDYVSSVLRRSGSNLSDQVRKMNDAFERSYVLVEGNLDDVERFRPNVPAASIRGSMASFIARDDTPVIPCSDRERLVDMAIRIGRKHVEEPSSRRLPVGAISNPREPTTKRMYGCIDGIGPELADALYEVYPTVESVLSAAPGDLTAIDGIGETRARAIYDAFRSDG